MKFGYTILYVADVRATLAFYEKAFGFTTRFMIPTGEYGELSIVPDGTSNSTTLAFALESFVEKSVGENSFRLNRKDDAKAPGAAVSFVIEKGEEMGKAFEKAVKAGATVVAEPKEKPWGQTVGYVRECNGFLVEICTSMEEGKEA